MFPNWKNFIQFHKAMSKSVSADKWPGSNSLLINVLRDSANSFSPELLSSCICSNIKIRLLSLIANTPPLLVVFLIKLYLKSVQSSSKKSEAIIIGSQIDYDELYRNHYSVFGVIDITNNKSLKYIKEKIHFYLEELYEFKQDKSD